MKYKEFAIWPFLGLDATSRKSYRYRLALNKSAMDEQRKEIEHLSTQLQLKNEQLAKLREEWSVTETANSRLEAENVTLKREAERLAGETKRQYKAYKALADRQESTERELEWALESKKATEIDNAMLVEKVEYLNRKIKKLDQPRKNGRFHKQRNEFPAETTKEEEIIAGMPDLEESEPIDAEAKTEAIAKEVIATAEAAPEEA